MWEQFFMIFGLGVFYAIALSVGIFISMGLCNVITKAIFKKNLFKFMHTIIQKH